MTTITIIDDGNIFNSKCQTIVNPINCVGVMEKGLALEMKNRFPDMFNKYKELCDKNLITIGKLWLYHSNITNQSILNFPTKQHWKHDSQYEFIELGCGNGKLNKDDVINIMLKYLSKCKNIVVEIYL